MCREELLGKLRSINGPLFAFTAFADGVTCEYVTHNGSGFMELLDWSDLDILDGDSADEEWSDKTDEELAEWVHRYESGEFSPLESKTDSLEGDRQ